MTTTTATTTLILHTADTLQIVIDNMSGKIAIDLLPIILGVAGIFIGLFGFLVYTIIESKISNKLAKSFEEERNLSKAEVKISLGLVHMRLYKTLYKERTSTSDVDKKAIEEIELALLKAQGAIKFLEKVKEKECFSEMFLAKNNFAYYLSRKWNYYRDGKDENYFQQFLEKDKEKSREYLGDKGIAIDCMNYLKEKKLLENVQSLLIILRIPLYGLRKASI